MLLESSKIPLVNNNHYCKYLTVFYVKTVTVSLGMPSYSFNEDNTSSLIDITLSQATATPISVNVRSQDVTAIGQLFAVVHANNINSCKLYISIAGSDYGTRGIFSPFQSTVVVPAGSTAAQFSINIIDDDLLEQIETFRLNIVNLLAGGFCGATTARTSSEVTIIDNDG